MNFKKLIDQIKEKAVVTAVWFMLSTGAVFLYNNGAELWNLPGTVKNMNALLHQMQDTHTKDSLIAVGMRDNIIGRLRRLEYRARRDSLVREDVKKIKRKLKLNTHD